jgi:hypothetical protein
MEAALLEDDRHAFQRTRHEFSGMARYRGLGHARDIVVGHHDRAFDRSGRSR